MFVIYGRIFWVARKHMYQIHASVAPSAGQDDTRTRMIKELKAARQLSTIVLVYFICHAVFLVILGMGYNANSMPIDKNIITYKASLIIMFFNSAINPIVYALQSKEFREAFKRILCPYGLQSGQSDDTLGFTD
jgi:hypothetical protein